MYWDDKYGTQSVSNEASFVFNLFKRTIIVVSLDFWTIYGKQVVSEMREIVSKDNQVLPSNSFLLDDDLRYTTFSHPSSFHL